jgi:hypothetical protein
MERRVLTTLVSIALLFASSRAQQPSPTPRENVPHTIAIVADGIITVCWLPRNTVRLPNALK